MCMCVTRVAYLHRRMELVSIKFHFALVRYSPYTNSPARMYITSTKLRESIINSEKLSRPLFSQCPEENVKNREAMQA